MNQIVCFLLIFLDEENAFWVFSYLIEKVLPSSFFSKIERGMNLFGFHAEYRALSGVFPKIYNMSNPQEIANLSNFIEMILPSLLIPLYVDILNFASVYYIISSLIENRNVFIASSNFSHLSSNIVAFYGEMHPGNLRVN